MKNISGIPFAFLVVLSLLAYAGCGKGPDAPEAPRPRPVNVLKLREIDPVKPLLLTGSVKSWKEQDLAFEVDGRMERIVEMGTNFQGLVVKGEEIHTKKEELARLDRETFRIQVDIAKASLEVARQQLETAKIELEKVLPANLTAAEAMQRRAEAEWERNEQAIQKDAISEVDFIRSTADRDSSRAEYEKAKADIEAKKAEIEMFKANMKQAGEKLAQAEYDLNQCVLYAPFPGEVSEVYVETGGYVRRGDPVAHLVMMDPIKVDLAVSADTAARLELSDEVHLSLPGGPELDPGRIYEKATAADPETRTLRISVMIRNRRTVGLPPGDPLLQYPRITRVIDLNRFRVWDENSPYSVEANRSLRKDEAGHFVWVVTDWASRTGAETGPRLATLMRYRVNPGNREVNFLGLFQLRELTDIGDLKSGMEIAVGVPDGIKDGDQVLVATQEWLLRPGQLVRAMLHADPPKPGLYVPMNAVKPIDGESGEIFIAADGHARKVEVRLVDEVGENYLIAPAGDKGADLVKPGALVIMDYIHFLQEGEPVRVIKMEELKP
jgi:multidrug efflux pump subunit AcrA (membrane-fusion protein)